MKKDTDQIRVTVPENKQYSDEEMVCIQTFLYQCVIIYLVNEIYADIFLPTSLPTVSHPKICVPNKKKEMIEEISFFILILLFFSPFFSFNYLQFFT